MAGCRGPRHLVFTILLTAFVLAGAFGGAAQRRSVAATLLGRATVTTSDGTVVDGPRSATSQADYRANPPSALTRAIDGLLQGEPGVYGVLLCRADGTILYRRNSEIPFVSASLYKLVLLADIALAVDEGSIALDLPLYVAPEYFDSIDGTDAYFDPSFAGYSTTVEEAMFATGAYSSNVAAKALLSVTSPEEVNAIALELGLTGTTLFLAPEANAGWPPQLALDTTVPEMATAESFVRTYASDGYVNLTTPRDMARYFSLLVNGQVFNERVSAMIMTILEQQVVTNRFPVLLPGDARMAHKTGNLDHVVHDVGVIYTPDGPVVLAAMVQAPTDDDRAAQVIQRLALIAYGELEVPAILASPVAGASPVAVPVAPEPDSFSDGTAVEGS